MEQEAYQADFALPQTKQSFIYKKNPVTAAKSITRKLRPSLYPNQSETPGDPQNTSMPDDQRNSQIEAETIATQGLQSVSPRTGALSSSANHFARPESGSKTAPDNSKRPGGNRRTTKSLRGQGAHFHAQHYYEDNIDSETEVFFDPQFESKLTNTMPGTRQQSRDNRQNNRPNNQQQGIDQIPYPKQHDKQKKRRLIADLQQNYRNSQYSRGQTDEKPSNAKRYRNNEDDLEKLRSRNPVHPNAVEKKVKTAKQSQGRRKKLKRYNPDDQMMDEFVDSSVDKANYLTQDEAVGGQSRLAYSRGQLEQRVRVQNDSELLSQQDESSFKTKKFTPGKIRASRMRQKNLHEFPSQQNNYLRSPVGSQEFPNGTFANMRRGRGKNLVSGRQAKDAQINDSQDSIGPQDNNLLPAVRRVKSKKRSNSGSPDRQRDFESSKMNGTGAEQDKKQKNIDQGNAKSQAWHTQNNFFNNTQEKQSKWQINKGEVAPDSSNRKKSLGINRRYKVPGGAPMEVEHAPINKKAWPIVDQSQYTWDLDGRMQKKEQKKEQALLASNASLGKTDLPNIGPYKLSPRGSGQKSQPPGRMPRIINPVSRMQMHNAGVKFIDPNAPKAKAIKANQKQSAEATKNLLIDIENRRVMSIPRELPFEMPVRDRDRIEDEEMRLPDYECPVCKRQVNGSDTAKHSRQCRTHACRYCSKEQPISDLEKHEAVCETIRNCNYCLQVFQKEDFKKHQVFGCPESIKCEHCDKLQPKRDIRVHEELCSKLEECRFCRNSYKMVVLHSHEASCSQHIRCDFCVMELPKDDYDFHLQRCPQVAKCSFCFNLFKLCDISMHMHEQCGQRVNCQFCGALMSAASLESHVIQECPRAKPGVANDTQVDPRPYHQMLHSNAQKLVQNNKDAKLLVEDDFVTPNDFRNPGGRKRESSILVTNNQEGNAFGSASPLRQQQTQEFGSSQSIQRSGSNLKQPHGKRDSSAAKPPLSPPRNEVSPSRSQKANPSHFGVQHSKSMERNKGILKIEQQKSGGRNPSNKSSQSLKQEREIDCQSLPSSARASRRGAQTRQRSRKNSNIRSQMEDNSIAVKSDDQQYDEHLINSNINSHYGRQNTEKDDDLRTLDAPQGTQLYNEDYGEQRGLKNQKSHTSVSRLSQDLRLTKTKSVNTASQVRFAHHASQTQVHGDIKSKTMKQKTTFSRDKQEKSNASVEFRRKSLGAKKNSEQQVFRKNARNSQSRDSNHRQSAHHSTGIQYQDKFGEHHYQNKLGGAKSSKSPNTYKVMETLTHHRVRIDGSTKILINGSEVLTHKGIKGNIHKVGVGFGTGRHTSGRRLDLLKEVPQQDELPERADSHEPETSTPIIPPITNKHRRKPEKRDAEAQVLQELCSEGCDPILKSMHSQVISAHYSLRDQNLSARTQTQPPEYFSVGNSAKPMSQVSMREQADQVTEGRFDPFMINQQIGTDTDLVDEYFRKAMADGQVGTDPVIISEPKPRTLSCLVQTELRLDESNMAGEPEPPVTSYEPITGQKNEETGSNGSLLDEPDEEEQPVVPECNYIDDWMNSKVYEFSFQLNYQRMLQHKLIDPGQVQCPEIPEEQKEMSIAQRLELNLNPEGLTILSQPECEWGQATLRHKSANLATNQVLEDLYTKAKTTIEVLEANMVRPDINSKMLFAHYKQVSKKTVIKLLIRVKKLYEARNEAIEILKKVMEAEAIMQPKGLVWRVLQSEKPEDDSQAEKLEDDSEATKREDDSQAEKRDEDSQAEKCRNESQAKLSLIQRALKILSDALTLITIFQQEHKLFRDEFRFNDKYFRRYMRDIGRIIGGYLRVRNKQNPSLQETGLLLDEHQEHGEQVQRYEEWVSASHAEHGVLDVPQQSEIKDNLKPEKAIKKGQSSRIDKAVEKMRKQQALKHESRTEMELTSKSEILAKMQQKAEEWKEKNNPSDQMLDRLKVRAQKKSQMGKEPDDDHKIPSEEKKHPRLPNEALLMQQLNYDDDMEDQKTQQNNPHYQRAMGERGMSDSILSMTTDMQLQKRNLIVTGEYSDFKQINANQFKFNDGSVSGEGYPGMAYGDSQVQIKSHKQFQSQLLFNQRKQFSDDSNSNTQFNNYQDATARFRGHDSQIKSNSSQIQGGFPQAVISELEGDDTEFTEPFDLSMRSMHNISHEDQVEIVDQSAQDINPEDKSGDGRSTSLKVMKHGSMPIQKKSEDQSQDGQSAQDITPVYVEDQSDNASFRIIAAEGTVKIKQTPLQSEEESQNSQKQIFQQQSSAMNESQSAAERAESVQMEKSNDELIEDDAMPAQDLSGKSDSLQRDQPGTSEHVLEKTESQNERDL